MAKKVLNEVPVTAIPEVAALEETKSRLRAFKSANKEFFEYLDGLLTEYNERLSTADKAVRAREVSCGDFELYQYSTRYDPDLMFNQYGRERFLALGGKLTTIQKVELDKKSVDIHIATGAIPEEEAKHIRKKSPSYHTPKPIELPEV
jgi:hypothetical protein